MKRTLLWLIVFSDLNRICQAIYLQDLNNFYMYLDVKILCKVEIYIEDLIQTVCRIKRL